MRSRQPELSMFTLTFGASTSLAALLWHRFLLVLHQPKNAASPAMVATKQISLSVQQRHHSLCVQKMPVATSLPLEERPLLVLLHQRLLE
jgi:hypothetical protein